MNLNGVYAMITKSSNATSRPDSAGTPILRRRSSSIGRDESSIGSLKGSNVSKVDGKTFLQRLRRRVPLGSKTSLASELNQERNASAVAMNEAMAMIMRLQEEKAAVQIQALQYQRMMGEQADYDQDTLQTMSELLIKKERDISFLEAEMETYRERLQFKTVAEFVEGWQAFSNLSVSGNSELLASFHVQEENYGKHDSCCRHG